jgi:hypothetical protein
MPGFGSPISPAAGLHDRGICATGRGLHRSTIAGQSISSATRWRRRRSPRDTAPARANPHPHLTALPTCDASDGDGRRRQGTGVRRSDLTSCEHRAGAAAELLYVIFLTARRHPEWRDLAVDEIAAVRLPTLFVLVKALGRSSALYNPRTDFGDWQHGTCAGCWSGREDKLVSRTATRAVRT